MKKTNCYILSLLMAAALTACSSDVDQGSTNGLTPISLTATVEDAEVTRAGTTENNAFSSGDAFTAYFPTNVRVGSTTSASSTSFSYNGTKWTPATQPYFNAGTSSATIHAYYGKVGGSSGTQVTNSTGTFTVATDQSTSAGYKASDLMYATTNIAKASPTASLTFQHKMAKIIVSATAGSGISKITAVRIIGGHRSINVTMPGCTLGTTLTDANTSSSYITMYSGGTAATAECAALVVPEASGFTGDFLEIVTDQGSVKYSLTSKVLASGKSYKFVLAVNAAAIGSTVAITSWTETSDATVTAGGGDFTIADIPAVDYDGTAKTPTPTVKYSTTTLTKDTDYTLEYVANTNAGKAAVIAIGKGDYVGKVGVKEFTINKAPGSISYSTTAVQKTYGNAAFTNTLTATSGTGTGTVTYSSSNTSVATVNASSGQVTIQKAGSATITATVVDGANYSYATKTASYTLTVAKAACTVSLSVTSLTVAVGQTGTFTVTRSGDGAITATSSDESIATASVSGTTVTVNKVAAGTATITVTVAAGTNYNAYTASDKTVSVSGDTQVCALSAATSSHIGYVICSNGHVHTTGNPNCGGTAVGILGKVTSTGHGLIVALKNAADQTWNTINSWASITSYASTTLKLLPDNTARGTLTSYTTLGGTTVSNWCVGQKTDYKSIFVSLGSTTETYDSNVNAYFTNNGGSAFGGSFWSATESSSQGGWLISAKHWEDYWKTVAFGVRPLLAF